MKRLLFLILSAPMFLQAQESGITWTEGLTWEQIRSKAKTENKYIFVDVYATWCGPCKVMDKKIYPLQEVGKLYNEKFISIRVQADRTEIDDTIIRRWYADAMSLRNEYKVQSYPTFLYFAPDGKLIHRYSGALNTDNFLKLAHDAVEEKGYTSMIEAFKKGRYEGLKLNELALSAKYAGDDSLARVIATEYVQSLKVNDLISQDNLVFVFTFGEKDKDWARRVCMPKIKELSIDQLANPAAIRFLLYAAKNDSLVSKATDHWITKMSDKEIFTASTLEHLKFFVQRSTDKAFSLLSKNADKIDKIIGKKNWIQDQLDFIVLKEEFYEVFFFPAQKVIEAKSSTSVLVEPDWEKISVAITKKYGAACAKRLQFRPRFQWYNLVGNKKGYTKYLVAEMDRTGGWNLNLFVLNNYAMEVFRYSTERKDILKAAKWIGKYYKINPAELKTDAAGIDTYATLLYKAGKIKESIMWEEKAAKIDPTSNDIFINLSKMKKGLPIWPKGFDVIE